MTLELSITRASVCALGDVEDVISELKSAVVRYDCSLRISDQAKDAQNSI
jgi:hypothetical protein